MLENGYIKLYRSIVKWEWWSNRNTRDLFIYLLLVANIKDSRFEGHEVPRGSLVCSVKSLSAGSGLTVREVRTALEHLKSTNELTIQTTSKYSIITIKNFDKFQATTNELTNNRQTIDKQSTNNRQHNKKNKEDKEEKESKVCYLIPAKNKDFKLTEELYNELTHTYSNINIDKSIEKLIQYLKANPHKQTFTKSTEHYLRMWIAEDSQKGLYSKPTSTGYGAGYDLDEYERTSGVDEEW